MCLAQATAVLEVDCRVDFSAPMPELHSSHSAYLANHCTADGKQITPYHATIGLLIVQLHWHYFH